MPKLWHCPKSYFFPLFATFSIHLSDLHSQNSTASSRSPWHLSWRAMARFPKPGCLWLSPGGGRGGSGPYLLPDFKGKLGNIILCLFENTSHNPPFQYSSADNTKPAFCEEQRLVPCSACTEPQATSSTPNVWFYCWMKKALASACLSPSCFGMARQFQN